MQGVQIMKHAFLFFLMLTFNLKHKFVYAEEFLAVLNVNGPEEKIDFYSDLLRAYANKYTDYRVITKENIEVLVKPEMLAECVGKCEVEIGRILSASYVITGSFYKKGQLILKFYNTKTATLINSVVVQNEIDKHLEMSFLKLVSKDDKNSIDNLRKRLKVLEHLKKEKLEKDKQKKLEKEQRAIEALQQIAELNATTSPDGVVNDRKIKPDRNKSNTKKKIDHQYVSPRVIKKVRPSYTQEALIESIEGTVLVRVYINEKGIPISAKIKRGLGYGLDEIAKNAALKWKFSPAIKSGIPVTSFKDIRFNFALEE